MKITKPLKPLLFLGSIFLLLSYSSLAEAPKFSISEAIKLALANNLEIKIADQELIATHHRLNQALRLWWPQLIGKGYSFYHQTNPNDNSQSLDNIPSSVPAEYQQLYKALFLPNDSKRYSTNFALEIKQLLLDNGEVSSQIQFALKKEELAQ